MKKSKVLSTPTRIRDLRFDELYDDEEDLTLKVERLNTRRLRRFRNEAAA